MTELNEEQLIKKVADAATFNRPLIVAWFPDDNTRAEILMNCPDFVQAMSLLSTAVNVCSEVYGVSSKKILKTITAGVKVLEG